LSVILHPHIIDPLPSLIPSMSYSPLSPPHSNRILSFLCNGKTKKVLFYLALKLLIVGLIFGHGSGTAKKPLKYVTVEGRTKLFEATANETCLLPNSSLFHIQTLDLPKCSSSYEDWLWVTVNGDVLPREGREGAYCKKRRTRDEDWTKLKFGERISDIMDVKCTDGGEKWQNFLWKLTPKEGVKRELREDKRGNLLIFELSPIGKAEFRQRFRTTIAWFKNHRSFNELKNVNAASDNYYVDGMFSTNLSSSAFSKKSHATVIIDRENRRNLSQFAHHYGYFRYPEESKCIQSDGQHVKTLAVLTDFLSSYRDSPHFASVHLSITKSSDTVEIDFALASWFDHNKHLLDRTTIVITAASSPLLSSSTTHKYLLDARLPFLSISPPDQVEEKSQDIRNNSSALISSSKVFSTDLLGANHRSTNCAEAGIGAKHCMCVERRGALTNPIDIQDVVDITDSIVTWINEKTLKYRFLCMTLAVDEVVEATKMSLSPEALRLPIHGKSERFFIEEAFTEYKILFTTKPGRKLFEATVVYFSAERTVEIDENSLRLISEEEEGDCSRAFPSVAQFCSCKPRGLAFMSRLFFLG
ncbi:hypothetical protein PRIPAC_85174, partial [Pristionchus pacificus]